MQCEHNSSWFCPVKGHEQHNFRKFEDLEVHLREQHYGDFAEKQLHPLKNKALRPNSELFVRDSGKESKKSYCPFCSFTDKDYKTQRSVETMSLPVDNFSYTVQSHIARHLEEVALLSLPAREDEEDVSNDQNFSGNLELGQDGKDLPEIDFGDQMYSPEMFENAMDGSIERREIEWDFVFENADFTARRPPEELSSDPNMRRFIEVWWKGARTMFESDSEEKARLLSWLSTAHDICSSDHAELQERIIPGSGEWILKHEAVKAWDAADASYLFLIGAPGTGKTYLTYDLGTSMLTTLLIPF